MLRSAFAGVRGHLGRLAATGMAVVFGVAFVAGTLIFVDTTQAAYTDAFARTATDVDVAVEAHDSGPIGPGDDDAESGSLTAAQLETVRRLPGVAVADGRMAVRLALLDQRGRPVTNFDHVGVAVATDGDAGLRPFELTGRGPAPGEVVLDTDTAERLGYQVGDTIAVVDKSGTPHRYPLVGLIDFGVSSQFSGQSVVGLPASVITDLTGVRGYQEIVIRGRDGAGADGLAATVARALGGGPRVLTGAERRQELIDEAAHWVTSFRIFLLLFGVVSLIVAAFVIYNTFAVLSALRIRQTALLRCIGATRRQIFGATVLESVAIGLVGGVLGVLCGIGVAYALVALFRSTMDSGIPLGSPVLSPVSVIVGLLLGLAVTVAAALLPAARATRVSPLAALRDQSGAGTGPHRLVVRTILTALTAALGIAVTVAGYRSSDEVTGPVLIVAGGVVVFLGVLIVSPLFIGPLSTLLGAVPAKLLGTPGRLATANARRNPGRTAITAVTLMIGIGLMSVFSVVMSSLDATASRQIAEQYPVDFVVTGVSFGSDDPMLPAGYPQAVRDRREFAGVAQVRTALTKIDGIEIRVGAIDPDSLGTLVTPPLTEGHLSELHPGTAIVARSRTQFGSTPIGDTLTVKGAQASMPMRVVGAATTLAPGAGNLDLLVSWDDLTKLAGRADDVAVLAKTAPGVSATAARGALDALTDTYPLVSVGSVAEMSSELKSTVNSLMILIAGLLGITVVISLFGIANTLALSVVERTRESATVRALGLTRGQLRGTLLLEALLMAAAGALVGIGFGLAFGTVLARKALSELEPVLNVPWGWFVGIVLLVTVTAVLAAVLPARRAARVSIVAAMADD